MVAFPFWPFELSPLNELYRGKHVHILMIFGIHVYPVKRVCHMQEWLLCLAGLFELSPLNELYTGKLVRSITLIPLEIFC